MRLQRSPLFDVISRDVHEQPTCCSYCNVPGTVVVLPLAGLLTQPDADPTLWVGLCAECVESMRAALAVGELS